MTRLLALLSTAVFLTGCSLFDSTRECDLKTKTLEDNGFKVEIARYSDAVESDKSILIFPPTGGSNILDRMYARSFCKAGFDVVILKDWTNNIKSDVDLNLHQTFYTDAQTALSLALLEVRSAFVGLLGTSAGGLHSVIASQLQDRLDAVYVITAGIPITQVIVHSDQIAMQELRDRRYKKYQFKNDVEYETALRSQFSLEPEILGEKYKMKDLGMTLSEKDKTVPYENQLKLKDYWNPQTVVMLHDSHVWAIVKNWLFESDTVLEFFKKSAETRAQTTSSVSL